MTMFKRDDILKDLREHVVEVLFIKVDGSNRTMRCTLRPEHLPERYVTEGDDQLERQFHADNPDVLRVWDVDHGAWRSFRISSVQYVQVLNGY